MKAESLCVRVSIDRMRNWNMREGEQNKSHDTNSLEILGLFTFILIYWINPLLIRIYSKKLSYEILESPISGTVQKHSANALNYTSRLIWAQKIFSDITALLFTKSFSKITKVNSNVVAFNMKNILTLHHRKVWPSEKSLVVVVISNKSNLNCQSRLVSDLPLVWMCVLLNYMRHYLSWAW